VKKQEARYAAKFTRDLLELLDGYNGDHWTKRALLSRLNWRGNFSKDRKACYCVSGGVRHLVSAKGRSQVIADTVTHGIEAVVGGAIPRWNDSPGTTWKDVKKVLTQVAKKFDKLAV